MAINIGDNFNYQGKKPNFDRDSFNSVADMKAYPDTSIDDGHISYCKEVDKYYKYKSTNDIDDETGKWREFKLGSNDYIIDYITEENGIITEEQYNLLEEAINTNKNIYLTIGDTINYIITTAIGLDYINISTVVNHEYGLLINILIVKDGYRYSLLYNNLLINPSNGKSNQVLTKTSNGYSWKDPQAAFPADGTAGQVLKKTNTGVEWGDYKIDNTYIIDYINIEDGVSEYVSEEQLNNINDAVANNKTIYIVVEGVLQLVYFIYSDLSNIRLKISLGYLNEAEIDINIGEVRYSVSFVNGVVISEEAHEDYVPALSSYHDSCEWAPVGGLLAKLSGTNGQVLQKNNNNVKWGTIENATESVDGLMSKEDKVKLNNFKVSSIQISTKAEYDAITNKGTNTIYFIKE